MVLDTATEQVYLGCIMSAFPLGIVHRYILHPRWRHTYSLFLGVLFAVFNFSWQIVHSFICSTVVFFILRFLPWKRRHYISAVFCVVHIHRQWTDYMGWTLDFTGPQMILTLKLIMFSMNFRDGLIVDKIERKNLTSREARQAVTEVPSALQYYSWVYFYAGFLVGPAVEYKDYIDFIEGPQGKRKSAPLSVALKTLGSALCWAVALFVGAMYFPMEVVSGDMWIQNRSLLSKILYVQVGLVGVRSRYYVGWLIAEAGCLATGFGDSSKEEHRIDQWELAENVKPLKLELGRTPREFVENWNIGTARFLRNYVFIRMKRRNFRGLYAAGATFLFSAFWHGFYPGYYLFFISWYFVNVFVGTDLQRRFKNVRGFGYLGTAALMISREYLCCAFILLSATDTWKCWRSLYFYVHIISIVLCILVRLFPATRDSTKKES